jgi:hypothetical protein
MAGDGLVQVEVAEDGRGAAATDVAGVQVEDARARAVGRAGLVARRQRPLAKRLDGPDHHRRLREAAEEPGHRLVHRTL